MAIEDITVKTDIMEGDGDNTIFPFDFRIVKPEDLQVYVKIGGGDYALKTLDTDYELDLITSTTGEITAGNIVYPKSGEPLTENDKIYAIRKTPDTQLESSDTISFKSKDMERALDKITMRLQEFTEEITHFITLDDLPEIIVPDLSQYIKNNTTQENGLAILGTVSASGGTALGKNAASGENAVAIGYGATATSNSCQLSQGTNSNSGTLQFKEYRLLNSDGTIPNDRIPQLSNKANTDLSNVSASIDYVVDSKIPTAQDLTWYRVWKSGWVEQGGRYTLTNQGGDGETITLPKEMANTNYIVLCGPVSNTDNWPLAWCPLQHRTTTTINVDGTGNITTADRTITIEWEVKGQGATDE